MLEELTVSLASSRAIQRQVWMSFKAPTEVKLKSDKQEQQKKGTVRRGNWGKGETKHPSKRQHCKKWNPGVPLTFKSTKNKNWNLVLFSYPQLEPCVQVDWHPVLFSLEGERAVSSKDQAACSCESSSLTIQSEPVSWNGRLKVLQSAGLLTVLLGLGLAGKERVSTSYQKWTTGAVLHCVDPDSLFGLAVICCMLNMQIVGDCGCDLEWQSSTKLHICSEVSLLIGFGRNCWVQLCRIAQIQTYMWSLSDGGIMFPSYMPYSTVPWMNQYTMAPVSIQRKDVKLQNFRCVFFSAVFGSSVVPNLSRMCANFFPYWSQVLLGVTDV